MIAFSFQIIHKNIFHFIKKYSCICKILLYIIIIMLLKLPISEFIFYILYFYIIIYL